MLSFILYFLFNDYYYINSSNGIVQLKQIELNEIVSTVMSQRAWKMCLLMNAMQSILQVCLWIPKIPFKYIYNFNK